VNPFDVDFKSFWLDMKRTFHWRDIPRIPLILWLLTVAKSCHRNLEALQMTCLARTILLSLFL